MMQKIGYVKLLPVGGKIGKLNGTAETAVG